MFISVAIDAASSDSKNSVIKVCKEYGIEKIQENLLESFNFPSKKLGNFKRDISVAVDMDDKLRIYQYPIENSFSISYIVDKKWKKLTISQ